MKRLSNKLSVVFLLVLLAAWVCSTGELVRAGCQAMNCKNKCILYKGWCTLLPPVGGTPVHEQFISPIAMVGGCTDGAAAGTPALYAPVGYDVYDDCVADCGADLSSSWSTAALAGNKIKSNQSGFFKSSCTPSS